MPRRTRTHPYLKGLTQTRARLAGQLRAWDKRKARLAARELAPLERAIAKVHARIECLASQQRLVAEKLAACDKLIRDFDGKVDPAGIVAIQAWAGRYGPRGNLSDHLHAVLDQHPQGATTRRIADLVMAALGITFTSKAERKAWVANSIRNRLREWRAAGLVEVEHPQGRSAGAIWRHRPGAASSLAELRARAGMAGVAIREADEDEGDFE